MKTSRELLLVLGEEAADLLQGKAASLSAKRDELLKEREQRGLKGHESVELNASYLYKDVQLASRCLELIETRRDMTAAMREVEKQANCRPSTLQRLSTSLVEAINVLKEEDSSPAITRLSKAIAAITRTEPQVNSQQNSYSDPRGASALVLPSLFPSKSLTSNTSNHIQTHRTQSAVDVTASANAILAFDSVSQTMPGSWSEPAPISNNEFPFGPENVLDTLTDEPAEIFVDAEEGTMLDSPQTPTKTCFNIQSSSRQPQQTPGNAFDLYQQGNSSNSSVDTITESKTSSKVESPPLSTSVDDVLEGSSSKRQRSQSAVRPLYMSEDLHVNHWSNDSVSIDVESSQEPAIFEPSPSTRLTRRLSNLSLYSLPGQAPEDIDESYFAGKPPTSTSTNTLVLSHGPRLNAAAESLPDSSRFIFADLNRPTAMTKRSDSYNSDDSYDTSGPFAKAVTVTRPHRVGYGYGSYIVYTCSAITRTGTISVLKRYSDFVTLREDLIRDCPGYRKGIPHLPPKKVVGNFNPTFIESRRRELEYFLAYVTLHPSLGTTPVVKKWFSS
ncbi:hypothetical protein BZG36_00904 [Bifiguratus adelaidae]|uniref:Endosomal/vacuolar adapter protein YPT35 n=1 Tax=Bifiguratus adelaidae TaxID=1938954 RepID=A0A261Y5F6_9FUNG|nr:hypothetical protein BZG36_00904 [Bifiguratus adelaidae]